MTHLIFKLLPQATDEIRAPVMLSYYENSAISGSVEGGAKLPDFRGANTNFG
jgi:hypothetical protein